MNKRVWKHILFWLIYTLAYAYLNTSFAGAPSDLKYSLPIRFLRFWSLELMMLPVKLGLTYGFLYWILPTYILKGEYVKGFLYLLILTVPLLFLGRFITFYVASPVMYGDYPSYQTFSFRRLFYTLLDIGSALGITATVYLLKGRLESERREQALIREKLQSELDFLKAQTNPHFLFNTLNNIYALARKQSSQTAPVILKLSQLLRFMLYECNRDRIPLADELRIIEDYIELEKLRYDNRLTVIFDQSIDDPGQEIAPLLLLPLIENAFKYGTSESRFDASIDIQIKLSQGILSLRIRNSREEFPESDTTGIGLHNVQRQLDLLYPDRHVLDLHSNETEFIAELEIILHES